MKAKARICPACGIKHHTPKRKLCKKCFNENNRDTYRRKRITDTSPNRKITPAEALSWLMSYFLHNLSLKEISEEHRRKESFVKGNWPKIIEQHPHQVEYYKSLGERRRWKGGKDKSNRTIRGVR